ncbi:MAG: MATE family efflux transporter [candidate division KSB1 bacterium]|nr:MATE family efflux transporter [candidate division KSB1 bacterium]
MVLDRPLGVRAFISRSWSVSWPMTLIMFFEFLIGLTDVYIAGRVSKEVQAAYGFVIQLYFIFIIIANALTVGTVSVVSRLFTSKNKDELTETIFSSIVATTIAGFVLAVLGIFLNPTIIKILNIPQELKPLVISFIYIYASGLLFHYVLINCNGILRSCNMVKQSLRTMALVCVVNIPLNFFFVFHTPIRFRGIALATASSVFIGSMVNLIRVRSLMVGAKRFSMDWVKKIASIGWPIGLLQILWQLSSMVLFLILSALPEHKIEILAALTTGLRIESAIYLPVFGFNMANAVIVGNLLGERKEEDAFKSGIVTATIGVVIVTLMVIAVVLNARWIVSFLSNNEIVIRESVKYIFISMISEPLMAWSVILSGGLNGAGDTRSVLIRIALSVWSVRIPLSYIFVVLFGFGPVAVWWSMNISQFLQAFLISKRYFSRRWFEVSE